MKTVWREPDENDAKVQQKGNNSNEPAARAKEYLQS